MRMEWWWWSDLLHRPVAVQRGAADRQIAFMHAVVKLTGTLPPCARQAMAAPGMPTVEEVKEAKEEVKKAKKKVAAAEEEVEEAKKTLKQLEGGRRKEE